ncbi:dTDP-4-dehydrorhamnose reductase [Ensifer sp. SL37]|uniref:dTDP-4-dehydrorhamnose reductase n=1 Tax=Ensifer sp. SL37 TaxID=2995137 RepID=UPI0022765345|nr:dTDP-4-dehydrorhamnose reductase [Ensifer sp. SL37]MCY1740354.1 dTDP-4-dehydrorhamnose reductase [Ensifer sp. SL37]
MRRILITGGTGQVGTELLACRWPSDVELVAPTRKEFDLSQCDTIATYLSQGAFDAVVNCGAYTAVDRAESDVLAAWKINALAPAALAAATKLAEIPLVHLSTDYVFDGSKSGPYTEDDPVAPLGVYGASKEAGEQAVRTGNPRHIILRTAWVFSPYGNNFVKTMLRLGKEKELIRVVADQRGRPTAASDIAAVTRQVVIRLIEDVRAPVGTYHFVGEGDATWYTFARELFARQQLAGAKVPLVEPITTEQYPTPARRPKNSSLSTTKLERDYGVKPRDWRTALEVVRNDLEANQIS